jgi:hypothetical protein
MPSFCKRKIWGKYEVGTIPENSMAYVLPYFWDSEVYLGLEVKHLRRNLKDEVLNCKWELCGIDDTVIKSAEVSFRTEVSRVRWGVPWTIKKHTIPLGYLSPNKQYRVFVTFSQNDENPDREVLATFTVKDRDEIKSQLFILLFGIVLTIILTRFFA